MFVATLFCTMIRAWPGMSGTTHGTVNELFSASYVISLLLAIWVRAVNPSDPRAYQTVKLFSMSPPRLQSMMFVVPTCQYAPGAGATTKMDELLTIWKLSDTLV